MNNTLYLFTRHKLFYLTYDAGVCELYRHDTALHSSVISRSNNNILPSSEMGAYHSRSYMTNINNDASSEMGWPTTHHHSKLATDIAIGNNAVQSNKLNLVSPEAIS